MREGGAQLSAAMHGQRATMCARLLATAGHHARPASDGPPPRRLAPTSFMRKPALQTVGGGRSSIRSTIGINLPLSICNRRSDGFCHGQNLLVTVIETSHDKRTAASRRWAAAVRESHSLKFSSYAQHIELNFRAGESSTCVTLNGSGIQLAVGPQPLRLRNHNFGLTHRIMVKRLATSPHDPLGITDSACKNQLVVVSVQYGPFYTYIPIRSTTIGKSRVARDPLAMHTSWRSNSDIASVTSIGYPRMKASGESSTTKHRLLHASGPHPIPPPNDPKGHCSWLGCRVRVLRCGEVIEHAEPLGSLGLNGAGDDSAEFTLTGGEDI
ncbi:hypothetical protein F511_40370 [Dorcoceras hygrometricum]|uniref:Uncharacterized protein n=1 Tax=Dorcoceras hygrometricum TaxID=472368 RepID=A0A2Z7DD36_9LAMI|nr:hypothetical protein F511_40370 [Dorcoceras hygrometricum]